MGRKRTYRPMVVDTVVELREQGLGYGTIAKKLGIHVSKVRRILAQT